MIKKRALRVDRGNFSWASENRPSLEDPYLERRLQRLITVGAYANLHQEL